MAAETKNATVTGITREKDRGRTVYEVETKVDGKTRDITIDTNGAVVVVEQEVELASIPTAARAALEKQAAGGRMEMVESVTRDGKTTYEVHITKGRKKSEFSVNADGTPAK